MADALEEVNVRRLIDQAALMQNIEKIKTEGVKFDDIAGGPYVNGISLNDSENENNIGTIINKIYNFKEFIEAYNKLTPASLSAIVPYIEIWKIYEDGLETIIPFNNFYPKSAIDAITSNASDRGHQANLLNVEFVSQGKDTATMFIQQVKLNIILDSIQTLFNDNSKYIELFNPPKKHDYKRGDFDDKYYQIKLKFGWKFDESNIPAGLDLKPAEIKKFTDVSGTDLFLNYVMHKITINEDGSVSLQIEYIGSLEMQSKNSFKLNVLSNEKTEKLNEISQTIKNIEESLDTRGLRAEPQTDKDGNVTSVKIVDKSTGKETTSSGDQEQLEKYYKQQDTQQQNNRPEFIKSIFDNISKQYFKLGMPLLQIDYDYYINIKNITQNFTNKRPSERKTAIEELNNIRIKKTFGSKITFPLDENLQITDIEKYLSELNFKKINQESKEEEKNIYNIPFFTFGRLLKAIQSLGNKNGTESDFIILASDCDIANFGDGNFLTPQELAQKPDYQMLVDNGLSEKMVVLKNTITSVNILQLPIALSTFKYFIYKNITSQNLTQMSLINFLNLLINDLLNLVVKSSNEDYIPKQNIQFKFNLERIQINKNNNFFQLIKSNQGLKEILNKQKLLNVKDYFTNIGLTADSNIIKKNIITIYSIPKYNTRKSDFVKDTDAGIPHFFYGQNKGIINKITFREESMPYAREANIQTQVDKKAWKPGVFLRGKYNVLIEMLGTINFRVGTIIYISPSFPGVLNYDEPIKYGIGGYFIILSIKTNIESGRYITSIEANWVATGTGEYTDLSHTPFTIIRLPEPLVKQKEEDAKEKKKADDLAVNVALAEGASSL